MSNNYKLGALGWWTVTLASIIGYMILVPHLRSETTTTNHTPTATELDRDDPLEKTDHSAQWAQFSTKDQRQAAQRMIRRADYACDAITSFRPWTFSRGWSVSCNDFRYSYHLVDKGGHWLVEVQ